MRQPYASLFDGWESHPLIGEHFVGDVPDWDGIMESSWIDALSSGEVTLLWVGLAIYNGDQTATVADVIRRLDTPNRRRVLAALEAAR
jgi:hypothetical protein